MLGVADAQARETGKTADLAFGYMGGVGAWQKLAPDDTSTEDEIKQRQLAWRRAHPKTVAFWGALNRAAIQAVRKPDAVFACGRVAFKYDGTFLRIRLPSRSAPEAEDRQVREPRRRVHGQRGREMDGMPLGTRRLRRHMD